MDGDRVRIPSYLIKKALSTAPSRIVLCDRDGNRRLFLEENKSYFGPGPTCPTFTDPYTGKVRQTVKQDAVNTAIVCDALPNIDFVMSLSMISDCTTGLADVYEIHAMLQNTVKPIVGWAFDLDGVKDIVDMCAAVAGGLENLQRNPFIVMYSEPTSPLTHSREAVDILLFVAENNLPAVYTPGMLMGGTVPVTMAGALATGIADNLVGLLLGQLKREGSPYIGGAPGGIMDMTNMRSCFGSPEFALLHAAYADIYHYLGLPIWGTAGCTDSKVMDSQAAAEAAIGIYSAALSGANLIHDCGFLDAAMTGSLELLVMCNEIIGMVRRMIHGVDVTEDTLALDVVDQVGPGGSYLGVKHTFKNFKGQTWFPTVFDRRNYRKWVDEGKTTAEERLNETVKQILKEHKPEPLPEDVVKQLDAIVERAEARAKK